MQLDSTKLLLHLLRQCGLVVCSTAAQQKHWTLNDVITYVHEIKREKTSFWNAANYYSKVEYCFDLTGNTLPMGPLTAFHVRLYRTWSPSPPSPLKKQTSTPSTQDREKITDTQDTQTGGKLRKIERATFVYMTCFGSSLTTSHIAFSAFFMPTLFLIRHCSTVSFMPLF